MGNTVPVIDPLMPELNPSVQQQPAEVFNWGF